MTVMNYRAAVAEGLARAMRTDHRVVLLGEDVAAAGGVFKTTAGLLDEFGPNRVWDTPISEQAIIGAAMGAALNGLRPVAELMFADFAGVCFDGIVNQVAKARSMSAGQLAVPLVIRAAQGGGLGFGAQHSQCVEGWFAGVPGLKVVAAATAADVVGLVQAAIADPDPVVFLEHKALFDRKDEVPPAGADLVPLGQAARRRAGDDVTVVCLSGTVPLCLAAAEVLATDAIQVDVLDLRSLVPLDRAALYESVRRTATLVVVEEAPRDGGWGAAVVADVVGELFYDLDRPPVHLGAAPVPLPYAQPLEAAALPGVDDVVAAVRKTLAT
jgi:acetoin:2,6-dichlorophenolindophenol oxidoreductase subunit beta